MRREVWVSSGEGLREKGMGRWEEWEMWADVGRCGRRQVGVGEGCWEMWADVGRCGEIWGDVMCGPSRCGGT